MPVQVHRMFFHFSELPLSTRTLFTATLIVLGFAFQWICSMYQLWFSEYSMAEHPKEIVG